MHLEVETLERGGQVLAVHVRSGARPKLRHVEVFVVENERQPAPLVVHVVVARVPLDGHPRPHEMVCGIATAGGRGIGKRKRYTLDASTGKSVGSGAEDVSPNQTQRKGIDAPPPDYLLALARTERIVYVLHQLLLVAVPVQALPHMLFVYFISNVDNIGHTHVETMFAHSHSEGFKGMNTINAPLN